MQFNTSRQQGHLLRHVRITLLLLLLMAVVLGQWQARSLVTAWETPLWVILHPVNGDGSDVSAGDLATFDDARFAALEAFFRREAGRYGIGLAEPVVFRVGTVIAAPPPLPPIDGGPLAVAWWSLKLRYWAFSVDDGDGPPADVRIAVRYFDPATNPRLPHSLGLAEARVGIVNAFADGDYRGSNRVVIAHELLHALGASDKYDPASNLPRHPDGYAEPERVPRYPQVQAELMAGRIPFTPGEARMPGSLGEVVIGPASAREIGWID
jgi:hypothetical protein